MTKDLFRNPTIRNMKNTNSLAVVREFDSPAIQSHIERVKAQVANFKRVLGDESALMKVRNAADLPALVEKKNEAIAELARNDKFLIHLFSDYADEAAVSELRKELEACQELNRINKAVAMSELNATRKSLDLLRSLQRMDDLPLYGAAGKISVVREKRRLGEA